MKETGTTQRIYGLDILRAFAILFVLQSHGLLYIRPHTNVHYYWLFILDGVDLFFVLSGFLIGGILIRTINNKGFDRSQLWLFWVRRWFRTLPNYFLVLIVLLTGYCYAFHEFPDKTISYFFFMQNFASPHPKFFGEAWSLSVEEWFYILIPLGLFFVLKLGRNKQKLLLAWICFVLIIATGLRIYKVINYNSVDGGDWDQDIRKLVITRMDSVLYGVLGAYCCYYYRMAWEKRKNILFITGILLLFGSKIWGAYHPFYSQYFYISAQSIGTLLLLPKLNAMINGKGIIYKVLTFISILSYSMYLLNYTIVLKIIMPWVLTKLGVDYIHHISASVIAYILYWVVTIFLAYLLYRFYERPMMLIRDRFRRKVTG